MQWTRSCGRWRGVGDELMDRVGFPRARRTEKLSTGTDTFTRIQVGQPCSTSPTPPAPGQHHSRSFSSSALAASDSGRSSTRRSVALRLHGARRHCFKQETRFSPTPGGAGADSRRCGRTSAPDLARGRPHPELLEPVLDPSPATTAGADRESSGRIPISFASNGHRISRAG